MKLVKSLFVGLVFLLFCCNSVFAQGIIPEEGVYWEFPEIIYDGTTDITMSDGEVLDCVIIYPKVRSLQSLPVIVFPNSWTMPKQEYVTQAIAFAKKGYLTVSFTIRGWYKSGGLIDVMGTRSLEDFDDIYDYLNNRNFTNVRADLSKKVTMIGISQGAIYSLLVAGKYPEKINSVVALSCAVDLNFALLGGGALHTYTMGTLIGGAHKDGEVDPYIDDVIIPSITSKTNMDVVNEYFRIRSPLTYLNVYNDYKIPILIGNNYDDKFFYADQALKFFKQLNYPGNIINFTCGTHAVPEAIAFVGDLLNLSKNRWDLVQNWVDNHVKNKNFYLGSKFQFDDESGIRTYSFANYPDSRISNKKFYLTNKLNEDLFGIFKYNLTTSSSSSKNGSINVSDGDSGFDTELNSINETIITLTSFNQLIDLTSLKSGKYALFYSKMNSKTRFIGTPSVELTIIPRTSSIQMVAYFITVGPAYKGGYLQTYAPFAMDNCVIGKPIKVKFDINLINGYIGVKDRFGLLITTRNSEFGIVTPNSFDILYGPSYPSTFTVPIYAE